MQTSIDKLIKGADVLVLEAEEKNMQTSVKSNKWLKETGETQRKKKLINVTSWNNHHCFEMILLFKLFYFS